MNQQKNFSNMKFKKPRKKRKTNLDALRDKSHAKKTQQKNKEAFDKSYFGSDYVNRDENGK